MEISLEKCQKKSYVEYLGHYGSESNHNKKIPKTEMKIHGCL